MYFQFYFQNVFSSQKTLKKMADYDYWISEAQEKNIYQVFDSDERIK